MTAPTSSSNTPATTPSEASASDEYMEMQGNSSPWTELYQADSAAKSRNAAHAASRQSAASATTASASTTQPQPQPRRSERPESDHDQRATQDALSAVFHQD